MSSTLVSKMTRALSGGVIVEHVLCVVTCLRARKQGKVTISDEDVKILENSLRLSLIPALEILRSAGRQGLEVVQSGDKNPHILALLQTISGTLQLLEANFQEAYGVVIEDHPFSKDWVTAQHDAHRVLDAAAPQLNPPKANPPEAPAS